MSSQTENERWVVCPVCHKANPAGTRFCMHCWGASLGAQKSVSSGELAVILEQRQAYLRRRRIIVRTTISLACALLVALIAVPVLFNYTDVLFPLPKAVTSDSPPGEWAMFRHDLANSGSVGPSDVVPKGTVKWTFTAGDVIHSSAAVANGTVYFGSRDGKLYAVDAETGAKRWEFQTGSRVESSPAIAGGVVYFGSNDGFLYALDANTGKEIWKFSTFYPVQSSPAVADGKVFFGSDDYSVYALDAAKGTRIWRFNALAPVESSPVVAGGLVYISSEADYIYVLNAATGRPRLHFKVYGSTYGTPVLKGDTAFAANFDGNLYAIDGNARNWPLEYELKPYWLQIWAFGLAPAPPKQSGFLWGLRIGRVVTSSPAIENGFLFIGADNNLICVDLESKKLSWSFSTRGTVMSTPAVIGSTVFVGSDDGSLYAVNSATGAKVWDFKTGAQITASPTVAGGVVYVGSEDGKLYAIE